MRIGAENENFKNYILLNFWRNNEVSYDAFDEKFGRELFKAVIESWRPQLAAWTATKWMFFRP